MKPLVWLRSQLGSLGQFILGTCKTPSNANKLVDELEDARRIISSIRPFIVLGLVALIWTCGSKFASAGVVWAFACIAVGFFFGFLFGIPKVLQRDRYQDAKALKGGYHQRVNTNLEEISDWVTKIIVGLGIYQLAKVPTWIDNLATLFASSVGSNEKMRGVFGAAIVCFLVCGFLLGYLVTRLYFQGAFGRADRAAAPDEVAMRKETEADIGRQDAADQEEPTGDASSQEQESSGESGSGATA
jgi:hypothetical protein